MWRTKRPYPQSSSWNISSILFDCPFGLGGQNVCLKVLQAQNFPLLHCNPKVGEREIVLWILIKIWCQPGMSRDCWFCANICKHKCIVVFTKFWNIYLCPNFKVVWLGKSDNSRLASIPTSSLCIHQILLFLFVVEF